jgi:hypothetical protein
MGVRKPVVAEQFYPADKDELISQIKQCFASGFGPGKLPAKRGRKKMYGAIVPHAGYFYSGACSAHAYKAIGEADFPDTYLILGVNHSAPLTCTSSDDWETPLGVVKCDTDFVRRLDEKGIPVKNAAHNREHSIEAQLPFLQFISQDNADRLRIVPIMIADERFDHLGSIIKEAIKESKRKVVVICSSDFTHYGHNYDYVPFEDSVKEKMRKLDSDAISFITKQNPKSLLEYTNRTGATICGRYGICTLLWLMKHVEKERKGELLKYYTSGDVVGNYENAVGYAAVVFR